MGNLNLNSVSIQDYKIETVVEDNKRKVLHLTISTEKSIRKFWICPDLNQPDLLFIKNDIERGLKISIDGKNSFGINEYPEKSNLYITYPDNRIKKYTGQQFF